MEVESIMSNKIVILDRDGVINADSIQYIRAAQDWVPLAGSIAGIARLSASGWKVVVATNQSGIARGFLSESELQRIHEKMCAAVRAAGGEIAAIAYCPHHPQDACNCRKPATGMLEDLERQLERTLLGAPLVGDSLSDMHAAQHYGCTPILVRTGKGHDAEPAARAAGVHHVFDNLEEVAAWLVRHW